jgi:hypothetical protein
MRALNRKQKTVLLALVAAIAVAQYLIFEENGIRGYGWLLSFAAIAGVLLLLFRETPSREASNIAPPARVTKTFSDLIFDLARIFREAVPVPPAQDTTTKVIQRDQIYGAVSVLAYGLLTLQRAALVPDYLRKPEHAQFLAMVAKRMATSRSEIASSMAAAVRLPGLEMSADIDAVTSKVLDELQIITAAIASGDIPRPLLTAQSNLLQVFVDSAPYVKTPEAKESLRRAMGAFVTGYLRQSAP